MANSSSIKAVCPFLEPPFEVAICDFKKLYSFSLVLKQNLSGNLRLFLETASFILFVSVF